MAANLENGGAKFGTLPVFITTITTILGAILFLRFGYAAGNVGFLGLLGIIVLGHMVTIPTAMAVAEIATNQKVQGGGAYYIISRSFGLNLGGAIGVALYISQAISVAFYVIAFAEAFDPVLKFISGIDGVDKRWISIPSMAFLSVLILKRGANVGMQALYVVAVVLAISLLMFFAGKSNLEFTMDTLTNRISNPDSFFYVFTIIFPAFTGLVAGLGLSGDLKDPSVSIPRGTLWATLAGFLIYIMVAYKMVVSATPEAMDANQLIMADIAIWGPIIPIGLAAAAVSSALGSILVAPRTLQALGADDVLPSMGMNRWLSKLTEKTNEPNNASKVSIAIAFFFILIGDINFVAQIISMFFILTYGTICLISLLEHFSADPSYRPKFKSRWYLSLIGAIFSFSLMFLMNTQYAILSILIMVGIYYTISYVHQDRKGFGNLFKGVIFQLTSELQIVAQRASVTELGSNWRPFVVCISSDTFKRRTAFDLLSWISYKYGFGTYIHFIEGYLSAENNQKSEATLEKLVKMAEGSKSKFYIDTMVSPSYTSALAQIIQLSGVNGKGNNMVLLEFLRSEPDSLQNSLQNFSLLHTTGYDTCILSTSVKGFGSFRQIDIWITSHDYENANLMILLGYIILGHPEWKKGYIKIFVLYNEDELEEKKGNLLELITTGRLPISPDNIEMISVAEQANTKGLISKNSLEADLTIVGFRSELVERQGTELFTGYDGMGNILFVNAHNEKEIK